MSALSCTGSNSIVVYFLKTNTTSSRAVIIAVVFYAGADTTNWWVLALRDSGNKPCNGARILSPYLFWKLIVSSLKHEHVDDNTEVTLMSLIMSLSRCGELCGLLACQQLSDFNGHNTMSCGCMSLIKHPTACVRNLIWF